MTVIEKATRGFVLTSEERFERPLEEVFAFFADAHNLAAITPPWLSFRIDSPGPLEMRPGLLIDYTIRLRGIPMRWQSEITAWEPCRRFVDEQRKGPYRYWIHEHSFEERAGATTVRDRVHYDVVGGHLVNRLFVQRDLHRIFGYRYDRLKALLAPTEVST